MTSPHALTDLEELSRTLGEPWRRFVILAEGNTSQRVAEDQLAVKATGRSLRDASTWLVAAVCAGCPTSSTMRKPATQR